MLNPSVLGTGAKRLTRRKRGTRRGPQRVQVIPFVDKENLTTPIYGCGQDILGGILDIKSEDINIKVTRQEKALVLARNRKKIKELPQLSIDEISYSLFSHEELEEQAFFEVKSTNSQGIYTVNDPRSGVVDDNKLCVTCGQDNLLCSGHYGIIKLVIHIIHPMFRRETVDILSSFCNSCAGLLLDHDTIEEKGFLKLSGSKRLRAIADASKKLHCRKSQENIKAGSTGCINNPIYKASKVKEIGKIFYSYDKKGKENERTVQEIEDIFNAITDEDAAILGFKNKSHPKRFILKSLPVIPLCARAPVIQDGLILKDHLTAMYIDIVRYNQELSKINEYDEDRENKKEYFLGRLTYSIEHFIDNTDKKYKRGKNVPYLSIKERIQGKEAIIRKLIQGKRVNFSARTVLSPDPNLKFGQIRLPRMWAPYLTKPEIVSPSNIGRLTSLFNAGKITHVTPSGGKYEDQRLKVIDKIKQNYNLSFGDIVDRWMQDGDFTVFNRQPTLHKFGIMGYEVVLGDPKTIGMHLSYTPPHNADFDGDEGTVHAPQSREVMLEVALLMCVKNNIMNAQNNKNIISVVYDALTASYLLSQPDTFIDPDVFMNITGFIENNDINTLNERLEKYHIPKTSGRALFSAIFPEDFYYRKNDVLITNGVLVSGIITEDHIGSSHGSIIQVLWKDYGQERTVDFLTDIYNIMRDWLDVRGFSIGLDDLFLTGENPEKAIQYEVQRAKMLVQSMGFKLTDPLEEERREKQIIAYLNTAKGLGARISAENLAPGNALNVMAKSGAKGSTFNIAQITGILGQQFVQGQRMPETISGNRRCLAYFPENSLDPAARGFCTNSFLTGLGPAEMFFHQAGGREGLTDTATKSITGDTPIIILQNGKPKRVNIGDWIDKRLSEHPSKIKRYQDRNMELLELNENIKIPTVNLDGEVSWGSITAITRHDPGKELYRIKTIGGRKVTVTESHSLLIWNCITKQFQRTSAANINIGDFVPTTQTLCSSNINKYINMEDYLPKNLFLYGTDFMIARDMVQGFNTKNKSPPGWWSRTNGTHFTLPYIKTAGMLRVLKRSNITHIKCGQIYPFRGRRINTIIPEKLDLNRENGFFIGLYLAEGDANIKSGHVRISNNDPTLQKLVQKWFEKFNIKWEISSKINHIGGTSTSSTVMAEFLIKLVGTGAHNKHVPIESYVAPDEFNIGLLDGYISGDGTITRNSIQATSCSKELIEGICFLCSKLGIFSKMSKSHMQANNLGTVNIRPIYTMSIRAQWATKFSKLIKMSLPEKQERLLKMKASKTHRNFPVHKDIVLDEIVSIKKIDIKLYSKVYDLTVPSTLNFGLANGLHVVDTADTGSMHHRVIKALEDVKIYEDGSARNAFGVIFQFVYGDDGFDASMLELTGTKTGTFTSFINTKRLAGRINSKYGYANPGDPDPEDIVPVNKSIMRTEKADYPVIPVILSSPKILEIGNVVNTASGEGIIRQIEGERVLVEREGTNPEWIKVEKLEE